MNFSHDEPTTNDRLGRAAFADTLAMIAGVSETPLTVGVFGGWGTGKTSLMRMVNERLAPREYCTVWFDAWQYENVEQPAVCLAQAVAAELGSSDAVRKFMIPIALAFATGFVERLTPVDVKRLQEFSDAYEADQFRIREAQVRLRDHFLALTRAATDGEKSVS